jgi:hypothetical protein
MHFSIGVFILAQFWYHFPKNFLQIVLEFFISFRQFVILWYVYKIKSKIFYAKLFSILVCCKMTQIVASEDEKLIVQMESEYVMQNEEGSLIDKDIMLTR